MEQNCEQFKLPEIPESPNYFQAIKDIGTGYSALYQCHKSLAEANNQSVITYTAYYTLSELYAISHFSQNEMKIIVGMTIMWTLVRFLMANGVYAYFINKLTGIPTETVLKVRESLWKFTAYFFLWATSFYVTFFRGHDFFWNTSMFFSYDRNNHFDLNLCYALEATFYIHSVFATLFLDVKRKDDFAMLLHHVVTLLLIGMSYKIQSITIGVLIFMLDDISDFLLELAKIFKYITESNEYRNSSVLLLASDISAGSFAVLWVTNRLYLHITKVQRGAAYGTMCSGGFFNGKGPVPLRLGFLQNAFVASLYIFYVYWFLFIAGFIFRMIFTRDHKNDPREKVE